MSKIGTDFGTDLSKMTKLTNIQKSKSGNYFLRIQRNGKDRKISLKTKDLTQAKLAAAIAHATISCMEIDPQKIKTWTLETNGQNIKITTDNTDEDRASALEAVKIIAQAQQHREAETYNSPIQNRKTITIGEALAEYHQVLEKHTIAEKTKDMARSTLAQLVKRLGASFNVGSNDLQEQIEEKWINARLLIVSRATVKRELSFIRSFIDFCAKKKYAKAPLDLALHAENASYEYFNSTDLKSLFDNASSINGYTSKSKIWLMILALYTGARLGQICDIELSFFEKVNGIDVLNFKIINKNKASIRKIPIHQDLIDLGLLEYVDRQKKLGRLKLIQLSGKKGSKFFTEYKRSCGINDDKKVFHSFRSTAVDCLKQSGVGFEERCQYVGHDAGGGVHNSVYARNEFSISHMKERCTDLMDWQKYCGWQLDINKLKLTIS